MQERLAGLSAQSIGPDTNAASSDVFPKTTEENQKKTSTEDGRGNDATGRWAQISKFDFIFDKDLYASRVYKRAMLKPFAQSAASSTICTVGWSFLSGLSLGEISNVSVIALPILPNELWNCEHYNVSEVGAGHSARRASDCIILLGRYHSENQQALALIS